jgi:RNA 2',3'-cyclic 3'-phosphodiesterase
MRLFVAVYPPEQVRAHLAAAVSTLAVSLPSAPGRSLRLADADRWHVTLAFLGEIDERRVQRAEEAVAAAAGAAGPCSVRIGGGGTFGRHKFTVLWAGLRGDVDGLIGLASLVRGQLRRARCPFDPRPPRPHLTLARPGDRMSHEALDDDIRSLDGYDGPTWTIAEVRLMRSHLGPRPTYDTVGRWPLTGPDSAARPS